MQRLRSILHGENSSLSPIFLFLLISVILSISVAALFTEDLLPFSHIVTDRDFANYWLASKLWLDGNVLDLFRGQTIYFQHALDTYGADFTWHNWSYPPHFVFFTLPLALVPLPVSYVAFQLVTLAVFLHAASVAAGRLNRLATALLVPFILCNILFGQNGFLTASLMLYGLCLRTERPILAGVAFGLLTIKPQLGILLPFLLMAERRWSVIISAAVTTILLCMLSAAVFGIEAWKGYIEHNIPYQTNVMRYLDGTFLEMMPSFYGTLRAYGWDADPAMTAHLFVAIPSVLLFVWMLTALRRKEARAFSLVIATFMITPYSLTYDLGVLAVLAAAFISPGGADREVRLNVGFVLLCILPIIAQPLAARGLVLSPLIIAFAWASLIYEEYRRGALSFSLRSPEPPAA
jgi:hypothetical protein